MRDTYSNEGPQCPYCGRQYTADEPHYYNEQDYTEEDCDECGKKFSVNVCHTVAWACEAIDDGESSSVSPSQQAGDK